MSKEYVVYDSRAQYDVWEASVMLATDSKEEAIEFANEHESGYVVMEYDVIPTAKGHEQLGNGRVIHTAPKRGY